MKNAIPTGQDLQNLWASTKVVDPTSPSFQSVDWQGAVDSNVKTFQSETGRVLIPLWQTRYFDPPQGTTARLRLGAQLCSSPLIVPSSDSSYLGLTTAPTGNVQYANGKTLTVTLQGNGLVTNADFYWGRPNAEYEGTEGEGRPWTYLDFQNFFPSPMQVYLRKSIAIAGYWGWIGPTATGAPQIPEDAWHAILHLSAIETIPEIELAFSRSRSSVKTQSATSTFTALRPQFEVWRADAARAIENNKFVEVY